MGSEPRGNSGGRNKKKGKKAMTMMKLDSEQRGRSGADQESHFQQFAIFPPRYLPMHPFVALLKRIDLIPMYIVQHDCSPSAFRLTRIVFVTPEGLFPIADSNIWRGSSCTHS